MTEPTPDLLPCPFCGGEAVMEPPIHEQGLYKTFCGRRGCPIVPEALANSAAEAAGQWNMRSATPANAGLVAALENALSLVRLRCGNMDPTGNAIVFKGEAAIASATSHEGG